MEATLIAKNVRRLRHGRNLIQTQVAKKAGISLATYSKIESGKASPRMDTLYRIASALGVGVHELLIKVRGLKAVRFRAQKKLKRRDQVLAKTANWLDDFDFLLREMESESKFTLSEIPEKLSKISRDKRPVEAARLAREIMKLKTKEPIHDIAGLLAANGIKVLTYNLASDAFFGMSIGVKDGGPAIVVNVWDRIPVERWIFSAAHELGHLLLHLNAYDIDVIKEDEEQEKEANEFASEFLMPQAGFDREWKETAGLALWDRILKVKRIYHVSYKTIIYRLTELGVTESDVWKKANIFLRKRYKQKITKAFEPEKLKEYDFVIDWLDRLVRLAYEKKTISKSRASEILDITMDDMRLRTKSWAEERSVGRKA